MFRWILIAYHFQLIDTFLLPVTVPTVKIPTGIPALVTLDPLTILGKIKNATSAGASLWNTLDSITKLYNVSLESLLSQVEEKIEESIRISIYFPSKSWKPEWWNKTLLSDDYQTFKYYVERRFSDTFLVPLDAASASIVSIRKHVDSEMPIVDINLVCIKRVPKTIISTEGADIPDVLSTAIEGLSSKDFPAEFQDKPVNRTALVLTCFDSISAKISTLFTEPDVGFYLGFYNETIPSEVVNTFNDYEAVYLPLSSLIILGVVGFNAAAILLAAIFALLNRTRRSLLSEYWFSDEKKKNAETNNAAV